MSYVQQQEPPDASYQMPGSSFDERIPFIKPLQILKFDSTGAHFVGFDEIKIKIPPYAIPDGSIGYLEVGVCLYGPFQFEENYQPISPILWLCLRENTHLNKPVSVTLPHVLPDFSEGELAFLGVGFIKANHECVVSASGERVYQFQPYLRKASYYSSGGKGYGTLQTDHFCFMCLAENSAVDSEKAQCKGYLLTGVIGPPSQLRLFATYFLETCVAVSDKIFILCAIINTIFTRIVAMGAINFSLAGIWLLFEGGLC